MCIRTSSPHGLPRRARLALLALTVAALASGGGERRDLQVRGSRRQHPLFERLSGEGLEASRMHVERRRLAAAPGATSTAAARKSPTPPGFPKVDGETQRVRDDVRKTVLADELASEQKLLADARAAYAEGAPPPLPEEKADVDKYRARIARLRQTVNLHEKNVDALKKELSLVK
jgi:hypothetical protein